MEDLTVTLYTSETCPYCDEIRDYFNDRGQIFAERRVDIEPLAALEVKNAVGDDVVPVVMVRRGAMAPVVVVGFDRQRLDVALREV